MKNVIVILLFVLLSGCVVIPKETVTLSQALGNDLQVLHNAHRSMVSIHYAKIKDDINTFVNDVYAPFVINYVLKTDLQSYKVGSPSLFGAIELAGQKEGKEFSENAMKEMSDFQDAARRRIDTKRDELISPILKQENQILFAVDQSYERAIYANSTITGYLQSIRKVKVAQEEALSMIGLGGADTLITNTLVKLSDNIKVALKKANEIDIKSDDANKQFEEIINKIKELTNNK